jgi:hypothetical protein
MRVAKGIFLGLWLFGFGTVIFLLAFLRTLGPLLARHGQQHSIDINIFTRLTIHNYWFWVALVACIAIGCALVGSWPGKGSSVFWVVLLVTSVIPVGLFGLFTVMVFKLKQIVGQIPH